MKFTIKNKSGKNTITLMRRIGYYNLPERTSQLSFVRPLERSGYPRFHIYLKPDEENEEMIFNIHLDQKKPVYNTAHDHAAEYEGKVMEEEVRRIKQILN